MEFPGCSSARFLREAPPCTSPRCLPWERVKASRTAPVSPRARTDSTMASSAHSTLPHPQGLVRAFHPPSLAWIFQADCHVVLGRFRPVLANLHEQKQMNTTAKQFL